jgi:hypothetical protein
VVTENSRARRGRPANEALGQTIVDAACELFVELGSQHLSALREQGGAVQCGHRGPLPSVCARGPY